MAAWRGVRRLLGFPQEKARALHCLLEEHRGSRVLVFTSENEITYAIARSELIAPFTCDIGRSERNALLSKFERGELSALVSAHVLNEGLDVSAAEIAIVVGGKYGEREHIQRLGRLLRPSEGKRAVIYELVTADTIEDLAEGLEIDPAVLARTVSEFNDACRDGDYNPAILDGKGTAGIAPPKSNWALPIDRPPYVGFITTTGITFPVGGLRINDQNEVRDLGGRSIPGLYAAGELVGGLFYENYPGGSGLMSGSVFGRRAGGFAAAYANGG